MDEDKSVPLNQIFSTATQERVPSFDKTLVGLGRPSPPMWNRSPVHRGAIVERAILGMSMNRNMNVGLPQGFSNLPT
jgi:hypothetical protein